MEGRVMRLIDSGAQVSAYHALHDKMHRAVHDFFRRITANTGKWRLDGSRYPFWGMGNSVGPPFRAYVPPIGYLPVGCVYL
jgi:hypothetical protein